jgi:hypothetical protein
MIALMPREQVDVEIDSEGLLITQRPNDESDPNDIIQIAPEDIDQFMQILTDAITTYRERSC